jgi:hypothetical protein
MFQECCHLKKAFSLCSSRPFSAENKNYPHVNEETHVLNSKKDIFFYSIFSQGHVNPGNSYGMWKPKHFTCHILA